MLKSYFAFIFMHYEAATRSLDYYEIFVLKFMLVNRDFRT